MHSFSNDPMLSSGREEITDTIGRFITGLLAVLSFKTPPGATAHKLEPAPGAHGLKGYNESLNMQLE